jgi:serine protease
MVELYRRDPYVEYAEPNYIARALFTPNDQYFPLQWNLDNQNLQMQSAWDITKGSSGVVVAVVDTGVAYENYTQSSLFGGTKQYFKAPDLANTTFVAGYDYVNRDTHPNDDEGHGTHVAGTIAQSTNNAIGVAGIAHNTSIMPVKVLAADGSGTYANVSSGIRWAADNGAKVINLSLGGSSGSSTLLNALQYAYNKGVTIVCAAGNDGASSLSYPAAYDQYCIAVGATRLDQQRAWYSNYGNSLDVVAPGGDNGVDQNGDSYADGILQQTFAQGEYGNFAYYFYQILIWFKKGYT